MDEVARIARERRPKLLLAGWSAYPRQLDFARFREIADEVGALLMVDMAHFAGLVAAGLHPNPIELRRRRGHDDDPQDARRPARRDHPVQGGVRQEDRLGRVPRPAGRPARARDRRQGGGVEDRRERAVRRAPAPHRRGRAGAGARAAGGRPRRQRAHRRHRRAPGARRPARQRARADRAGRPRTGWTRSRSRSTATPCRSTRARRWRPRACASARPRSPRAACRLEDFTEVGRILASALTPEYESRAGELAERVAAIVERYPLYEELSRAPAPAQPAAGGAGCATHGAGRRTWRRVRVAYDAGACDAVRVDGAPERARRALRLPGGGGGDRAADAGHDALRAAVGAIDEPRERGLSERPHAAARRPGDLRRGARRRVDLAAGRLRQGSTSCGTACCSPPRSSRWSGRSTIASSCRRS